MSSQLKSDSNSCSSDSKGSDNSLKTEGNTIEKPTIMIQPVDPLTISMDDLLDISK